ncbi:MAG: hypothetical protein ACR2PX_01130 [Endozoicomonas sp.]|uniref:hypothetical protein n=1 Tax=Endozoicomonas sp. TaxID=1892382 RepID=UPI003D9B9E5E
MNAETVLNSEKALNSETVYDFEMEPLEITTEEANVMGKLVSHVRQQHLTLNGSLEDHEARMVLRLLNEINNSIYHVGAPENIQENKEAANG